jgi:hypothetical protein
VTTAFELVHLKNDMVYRKAQSRYDSTPAPVGAGGSTGWDR